MAKPATNHHEEFNFLDFKKAFRDHLENDLELKVLICGRTGVGKSSLINVLVGREVFRVGGPGESDDSSDDSHGFGTVTSIVEKTTICVQDVLLHIYDSPGLQDGTDNEEEYLEDMYRKCSDTSLILYCVDMTTNRWLPPETNAINQLTEKFGEEFWNKSILVLTRCNMLQPPDPNAAKEYVKNVYDNFMKRFQKQLMKHPHVAKEVAENVPAIATGSATQRKLHYVSSNAESSTQDFLPEMWITCMERISGRNRGVFIKVTSYSGRFKLEDDISPEYEALAKVLKTKEIELRRQLDKERGHVKQLMTEQQHRELDQIRQQRNEQISVYRRNLPQLLGTGIALNQYQLCRYTEVIPAIAARNVEPENASGMKGAIAGGLVGGLVGGTIGGSVGLALGPAGSVVGSAIGVVAGGVAGYVYSGGGTTILQLLAANYAGSLDYFIGIFGQE